MRRSPLGTITLTVLVLVAGTLLSTTTVASAAGSVQVNVDHTIIQPGDQALMFLVVTQVTNPGDEPVDQLRFSLPAGYENFSALQGLTEGAYELVDGELVDGTPLAAGETREVLFSFTMPWDGEALEWTRHVNYPTQMLFVLVPEGALNVVSEQLEVGATQAIDDTPYVQYYAAGVAQDTDIVVRVELPETGAETGPDQVLNQGFHGGQANVELWMRMTGQPGHWGLAGVLGFAFGILLIVGVVLGIRRGWFVGRGRQAEQTLAQLERVPGEKLESLREDLMNRLVGLELEKRRGEVAEDQYEDERKEVLKQLVRVELALRKRS